MKTLQLGCISLLPLSMRVSKASPFCLLSFTQHLHELHHSGGGWLLRGMFSLISVALLLGHHHHWDRSVPSDLNSPPRPAQSCGWRFWRSAASAPPRLSADRCLDSVQPCQKAACLCNGQRASNSTQPSRLIICRDLLAIRFYFTDVFKRAA